MKEKMKKENVIKRIVIVLILLAIAVFVLIKAQNYLKEKTDETINLVINNNNVTARLKHEVKIKDGTIYLSMDDVENFFDKYIHIEEDTGEIVTTYETKMASLGLNSNKVTINGSVKKINAGAIQEDDVIYLPMSEMTDVYNMEIANIEQNKIITIDSLNREQIKAYAKSNLSVKWKNEIFSKTVDKVKKGDIVILISEDEKGWAKIRTENGEVGYVKANKLANHTTVREELTIEPQISGKVNMFWEYFSQYVQAPDRTGQTIEGVNAVSPSFFYLDDDGTLKENVGNSGIAYINWAHSNGYKVWPMVSNSDISIDETSALLNSYEKRQALIESIVEKCVEYGLDGINIDFEEIYEKDKDKYSRFIIELEPRMKELGAVLSVDVTAPDGDPNWSLCYDRNVLGDVADYLVFMAYDQHGTSSTSPGTTAGYNWVETSLKKIIEYDVVDSEKIILGIPFYTRQWTTNSNGQITGKGVVSMRNITIPNNVEKKWDDTLKQYYIEYASGRNTIRMWIEDATSIQAKVSLVKQYNLGGTSGWRKDMESDVIWKVISDGLKQAEQQIQEEDK